MCGCIPYDIQLSDSEKLCGKKRPHPKQMQPLSVILIKLVLNDLSHVRNPFSFNFQEINAGREAAALDTDFRAACGIKVL